VARQANDTQAQNLNNFTSAWSRLIETAVTQGFISERVPVPKLTAKRRQRQSTIRLQRRRKQVIDQCHAVVDVAKRLGISKDALKGWVNKFKKSDAPHSSDFKALQAQMVKLKFELRRTTEERDILKKADQENGCLRFKACSVQMSAPLERGGRQ
jgi:transposase